MKKAPINFATILLLLVVSTTFAQGVTRTPFLEIGDKPVGKNQWIASNNGGSSFSSNSYSNEAAVKDLIRLQKQDGFKKSDQATFLLANSNTLQSYYPLETGFTYRIFAVMPLPVGTSILRAKDSAGNELAPEVRNADSGSIFNFKLTQLQLQDIVCTENKNLILENGMMSDQTIFYATTYLIFRKKS